MKTYLVRYNRSTGSLDDLQEFASVDAAMAACEKAELEELHSGADVEISVHTAFSMEDLQAEHPRYFAKA